MGIKILVFSDSHRHTPSMYSVISKLCGDITHVLHLGDNSEDAEKMAVRFPKLKFEWVGGNCDSYVGVEKIIKIGGKRIYITHGHLHGVKRGYERITYAALEQEADVCFFGHTHEPIVYRESGVLFMNPGSISLPRMQPWPSYGVADISQDGVECGVVGISPKGSEILF